MANYKGRTIRFDGCVNYVVLHGKDYGRHSRYNISMYAWDYDKNGNQRGSPEMWFGGVTMRNLKVSNHVIGVKERANYRITAKVDKYDAKSVE